MAEVLEQVLVTAKEDLDKAINTINNKAGEIENKINETNTKIDEANNKISEVNELMSTNSILTKDNIQRKFKPLFGQYLYCMNSKDSNGLRTISYDTAKIDQKLTTLKATGIDYVELCIHIGFNSTTKQLFYQTNLDTISYIITKCEEIGLEVKLLKIHEEYTMANVKYEFVEGDKTTNLYDVDKQTASITEFKTQMEAMFTEIFTLVQDKVEIISVMNEWEFMWNRGNPTYTPPLQDADESGETQVDNTIYVADFPTWLVGIIQQAKSLGFKVGVSTAGLGMTGGFSTFFSVAESVYNACDIALLNMYPPVSGKGDKTTYMDCKQGWDNYFIHNVFDYLKDNYPNINQIMITETGCTGQWANLSFCGNPNLKDDDNTEKDECTLLYMKAMLDSLSKYTREQLYGVSWWYTNSLTNENDNFSVKPAMVELLSTYLGNGV